MELMQLIGLGQNQAVVKKCEFELTIHWSLTRFARGKIDLKFMTLDEHISQIGQIL